MVQVLKPKYKQLIRKDELLQAKIASAFGKKISTIKRWLADDHIMLSHTTVLEIIREHECLSDETELTDPKEHHSIAA